MKSTDELFMETMERDLEAEAKERGITVEQLRYEKEEEEHERAEAERIEQEAEEIEEAEMMEETL